MDFFAKLFSPGKETKPTRMHQRDIAADSDTDGEELEFPNAPDIMRDFVERAFFELEKVIRHDRLSLVEKGNKKWRENGLADNYISPRAAVPKGVRLELAMMDQAKSLFRVNILVKRQGKEKWERITQEEIMKCIKRGDIQASDSLMYATIGLGCAVIALEGERCLYQTQSIGGTKDAFKLHFKPVSNGGGILHPDDVEESGLSFSLKSCRILAINPNRRQIMLRQYIKDNILENENEIIQPLKHLIGAVESKPLIASMLMPIEDSYYNLNEFQKKIAHPLYLKTANEVAGPPGTGKTQVITELSKALMRCTSKNIVVLSERNAAIDAIAEKFSRECYSIEGGKIAVLKNMDVWSKVITFGSPNSMGQYTRMFTLEVKVMWHPDMIAAILVYDKCQQRVRDCAKSMKDMIANQLEKFGNEMSDDHAFQSGQRVRRNATDLIIPSMIREEIQSCADRLNRMIQHGFNEDSITILDKSHTVVFRGLLPVRSSPKVKFGKDKKCPEWNKKKITKRLKNLLQRFSTLLSRHAFKPSTYIKIEEDCRDAENEMKSTKERLLLELNEAARLRMSTIGSSGRLFKPGSSNEGSKKGSSRKPKKTQTEKVAINQPTVAIFDEAGCIPSFELLGLGLLDCIIESLVVVGDKHQLPPYDPSSMGNPQQDSEDDGKKKLRSMLDVSSVDPIKLCLQYRVPEVVASILNERIYGGDYETAVRNDRADTGLYFEDIIRDDGDAADVVESGEKAPNDGKKRRRGRDWSKAYVNKAEIEKVFELIRLKNSKAPGGKADIMVLSPYKKQQREIQRQARLSVNADLNLDSNCILTIDQCQGQEADIVLFTLVKKPTIFLNRFRMNVALSRFKKQLHIISNRSQFLHASLNGSWECALIARDLLAVTAPPNRSE